MKKILLLLSVVLCCTLSMAQSVADLSELEGQSCTSIMVGKKASTDGSVITSHTCDGRYRTWMHIEPSANHAKGAVHQVLRGTMHTAYYGDTTGVKLMGTLPQVQHTYAYLNAAYPCLNEKQLSIGETTFGGPDVLVNEKGWFTIEELERIALQRCDNARAAIRLIGSLVSKYGYGDGGECITIADKNEVWQMEILGEGPKKVGGVWAAQRIPDDHVGVSANIPRIGRLQRNNPNYFMCSDNIEKVAIANGLWDGKGDFIFWKVFNCSYANGKNFREREYFILNALAPSLHLTMDMDSLPFSVKPDKHVDVQQVMALLRSTYDGTDMDMCRNIKMVSSRKSQDGTTTFDTVVSPLANPWMSGVMEKTLNFIQPGTVTFRRTVSVAWCSYSFVTQLRDWLPDAVGGVCWVALDNPGQSPRIPVFCGTTRMPATYDVCGQHGYNEKSAIWKFRKANKLATVQWQRTRELMEKERAAAQNAAFRGLSELEKEIAVISEGSGTESEKNRQIEHLLNDYTFHQYDVSVDAWQRLEERYWSMFSMGF